MEDLKLFNEVFETIENKQDATQIMVLLRKINDCINKDQENFIELCYYFKQLKDFFKTPVTLKQTYYHGFENKNGRWYYEKIIAGFGLADVTVNKMIQVFNRFAELKLAGEPKIRSVFSGYNKTKLFELLPLSDAQIERAIQTQRLTPNMTRQQIREYVKSIKGGEKTENKVLEENNNDYETRAEEITDCGLYIKFSKENFDFIKQFIENHKRKYKDVNVFLNSIIKYVIDNKLNI